MPGLAVEGLTKSYGSAPVLRGVELRVRPGEVHALLGANGAGKSTLIKCLAGAERPDTGTIELDDRSLSVTSPRAGIEAGVSVIYQQFSLVESLSVADNVFLGGELQQGPVVQRRQQETETADLLRRLGCDISPSVKVESLSLAERQLVEIAKAVHRNARLLILDEPTASLSEAEKVRLLAQVQRLRSEGLAIIYVTHLLDEVFEVADTVSVLRDGRIRLTSPVKDVTNAQIIEAITGGMAGDGSARVTRDLPTQQLLQISGVRGARLGPIDFHVRRGEIVGVFGLLGSGRTELLETIFGIRPRDAGEIRLNDRVLRAQTPRQAIEQGIALVPADRRRDGLFLSLSNLDNLLLPGLGLIGRGIVRSKRREQQVFARAAESLRLTPPEPQREVWTLSGGNQQKIAVGRWLTGHPPVQLLLLDDPTQGVDVGARAELYQILRELAGKGLSVIFTSSSPDEVSALADRAVVLAKGRAVGDLTGPEITNQALLGLAHELENS